VWCSVRGDKDSDQLHRRHTAEDCEHCSKRNPLTNNHRKSNSWLEERKEEKGMQIIIKKKDF